MDGENNGKIPIKMDDLGGKPTILGNPHMRQLNRNSIEVTSTHTQPVKLQNLL